MDFPESFTKFTRNFKSTSITLSNTWSSKTDTQAKCSEINFDVTWPLTLHCFCFVDVMSEYHLQLSPAVCAKDRKSMNELIEHLSKEFVQTQQPVESTLHGYVISCGYQIVTNKLTSRLSFLLLDQAIASGVLFVIVSESDGGKRFLSQLSNSKTVKDIPYMSIRS